MPTDAHLLTDLRLDPVRPGLGRSYAVASTADAETSPRVLDLAVTATGSDNLAQAVILRLLTPVGELAALGHPDYGSRLHEVLGRPNSATTRSLVRLHILTALAAEPRIAAVSRVDVAPASGRPHHVTVTLAVQPQPPADVVEIGPLILELTP